jgi:glycosyltransferase involved in cell wall biosynthesis
MRNGAAYDVILVSRQHLTSPHLGITRAVEQISQIFLKLGLSVCIVAEGLSNKESRVDSRLTVISVPSGRERFKSMFQYGIPHPVSSWLTAIQEYLAQGRIVICPVVGLQSLIFKRLENIDCLKVTTLYTPYSRYSPLGIIYFALQKNSLKYSDLIIGNSKTILKKFKISSSESVRIIPNLSTFPTIDVSRKDLAKFDFVWIGALTLRKGVDRLIHFIVLNKGRKSVQIVWGKTRHSFFPLRILRFLEGKGWCEIKSEVSDEELTRIILNSKALLSTTRFESFGMTLVEAASLGKGTIGIRAPGVMETIPEICQGGVYFRNVSGIFNYLGSTDFDETTLSLGSHAKHFNSLNYNNCLISGLWEDLIVTYGNLASLD